MLAHCSAARLANKQLVGACIHTNNAKHVRVPAPSRSSTTPSKRHLNIVRSTPDESPELTTEKTDASLSLTPYRIMQALSAAGVLETFYLNLVKFTDTPLLCSTNGCASVLSSPYASLYGLPLPTLGLLAYATVGALATTAASSITSGEEPPSTTSTLLTAAATAMATTSAALMTILFTRLQGDQCMWCFGSAALSAGIFASAIAALPSTRYRTSTGPSVAAAFATVVMLFGGWRNVQASAAMDEYYLAYFPPEVTQSSPDGAVSLAQRLRDAGAKMYGAFWCGHCLDQKQAFGQEAMQAFPYQECYPEGWRYGVKLAPECEVAGIQAFPTWIIGKDRLEGELTFETLEKELAKLQ